MFSASAGLARLHLELLATGAALGFAAALTGMWRPTWRVPAFVVASAGAVAVGARDGRASTAAGAVVPAGVAGVVVIAAGIGAGLATGPARSAVGRTTTARPGAHAWILAYGLVLTGFVYLSVPDTEAAVALIGAELVALVAATARRRVMTPPEAGALVAAALVAPLVAGWVGARSIGATPTLLGWWLAKAAALVLVVAASVVLTRRRARPWR